MVAGRRTAASRSLTRGAPGRRLCALAELADGASRGFDPLGEGRDTMFVVRRGDRVFGWRNACPHYDFARMAWRKDAFLDAEGRFIRCAAHGALFGIADGVCVLGPCVGERLTAVPLDVADGEVRLAGPYPPGLRSPRVTRGSGGTGW